LLRHGDVEGRFDGDGSRVIASILFDAIAQGCHRELIRKALGDPMNKGGFACLKRRARNLDRWFDAEWRRAASRIANSPPIGDRQEAAARAAEIRQAAERLAWKGIGGATDLAVYRYAITVAQRAGRLGPLGLSAREVAEGAKVSKTTAARSLSRLVERRLLRSVSDCSGTTATQFHVEDVRNWDARGGKAGVGGTQRGGRTSPTCVGGTHFPTPTQCVGPVCPSGARPTDTWRWRGLGHAAERVHSWLSADEAVTVAILADTMALTPGTIRRHLATLVEHRLAVRTEDGWLRTEVDPVDIEEELGVNGMTEAQRKRHGEERQRHHDALAAYAEHINAAPFTVDPSTGEIVNFADLLDGQPPPLDAWPAGSCDRCGKRTGLDDFRGGWLCSRCEPFGVVQVSHLGHLDTPTLSPERKAAA
jgi:DNA-binding MarR family transcriptional regulator